MTSDEKFAVVAHLYVLLRRKCGRVIDTVWAAQNNDYALEVLRIARAQADADIVRLADRFEALVLSTGNSAAAAQESPDRSPQSRKYVDTLR